MNQLWSTLAMRVDRLTEPDAFLRVQAAMHQREARAIGAKPSVHQAGELLSLWQARLRITRITGLSIPGVQGLIHNLEQVAPNSEVEQYSFTGKTFAGSLFFHCQTGNFLGDTVVERRSKNQEILDLEAEIVDPTSLVRARVGFSRKSA